MTQISVELPDEFVTAIGSKEAAKNWIEAAAVSELARRGIIDPSQMGERRGESSTDWLRLALSSGAFNFWKDPEEDIYTVEHGEPLHRSRAVT